MLDDGAPLFQQIADQLSSDIVDGALAEGTKVPSTNEFAAFYRINPATAAKGINILVDDGILEKRRGIGMFVVFGAQDRLIQLRRKEFAEQYVDPLVTEARRLGIDTEALIEMIRWPPDRRRHDQRPDAAPTNDPAPINGSAPISDPAPTTPGHTDPAPISDQGSASPGHNTRTLINRTTAQEEGEGS